MPEPATSERRHSARPDLRELRRRIRAHERDAALADDRRHDHDVARPLAAEHRQRRARGVVGAQVVDVHQLRASGPARCRRSRRRCRSRRCRSSRRAGRSVRRRARRAAACRRRRVTSATIGSAWPPAATISAATASSRSARRAQMSERAPSRASRRAVARPMPADAPVIAITRIAPAYAIAGARRSLGPVVPSID